jgi:hypothetical protein
MSVANESARQPGGTAATRVWALFLAVLAAGLLILAMPRLIAAILWVPGDAAFHAMDRSQPVTVGQLDSVIDSRQAAGKWIESGRNGNAIGIAAMFLLNQMEILPVRQPAEEATYLDLAILSLRDGLALEPAQPYAWFQLTYALMKRNSPGDVAGAERAWRMAVLTGGNETNLLIPRLTMGLFLWPDASPRTRAMIEGEVIRTARIQPRSMARQAMQLGAGDFIREVLARRPDLLAMFDEMLRLPEAGSPLFP